MLTGSLEWYSPRTPRRIWNALPRKPVGWAIHTFHKRLLACMDKAGWHFEYMADILCHSPILVITIYYPMFHNCCSLLRMLAAFTLLSYHMIQYDHRRRSSFNFGGARHFCPKIYAWKIKKMSEFYVMFARKINKIPEFYMICARKN